MSERELHALRTEVRELRFAVEILARRVSALEVSDFDLVSEPEQGPLLASAPAPSGASCAARPCRLPASAARPVAEPVAHASAPASAFASRPASASASAEAFANEVPGSPTGAYRTGIARDVGSFLGRAVRGEYRGSSRRSELALASRYYIVLAGFDGEPLPEAAVYSKFDSVRKLCLRGQDKGRSVFVGLPSQVEVSVALQAAGYKWPSRGIDGRS